jgi:ABC-2 type transport system permease protein
VGTRIYEKAALQLFWLVILVVAGKMLTKSASKKVVVQGG